MEDRRYRDGKFQVRGNVRRPFRHACRIQKLANSITVHYSLLPVPCSDDTATVYYNYRHYEPVMGRWMQRDPIEEDGGEHLYCFVQNSAVANFDVYGQNFKSGEDGVTLTYIADSPGFDGTEAFARVTHPGYIDLNDIGDFSPNSKLKKCQCVEKLTVIAHGIRPKDNYERNKKHKFKWGSTILYEGANDTPYANVTSLSEFEVDLMDVRCAYMMSPLMCLA